MSSTDSHEPVVRKLQAELAQRDALLAAANARVASLKAALHRKVLGQSSIRGIRLARKRRILPQRLLPRSRIAKLQYDGITSLYQHHAWLGAALSSIGDAVIVTDTDGCVVFLNNVAESLTGWPQPEALGKPLHVVYQIMDEQTGQPAERPLVRALRQSPPAGPQIHLILRARDGREQYIEDGVAPIRDEDSAGRFLGIIVIFRDVSARRQIESLHLTGAERLSLALEAGCMGVWEWDMRTDKVWWSKRLEVIYGLTPGAFGGTFAFFQSLIHPEDRAFVRRSIALAIENREMIDMEFRIVWPDGSVHWIASKGRAFCDAGSEPTRMVGVSTDVTERRLAAEAVRKLEARLASVINHAPAIIYIKDPLGRYMITNGVFERTFGMASDFLVGKTDFDIFSRDLAERFRKRDLEVIATGQPQQCEETFEHGGARCTFLTVRFLLPDKAGEPAVVCGIATDISDRKRAEEAVRQSTELYRSLAEGMPLFVFLVSPAGQCEYCNARWHEWSGLTMEHICQREVLKLIHPDDVQPLLRRCQQSRHHPCPFELEFRMQRKSDPTYRFYLLRATPLQESDGRVVRWVAAILDIDDSRRAEETVRSLLRISAKLNSTLDIDGLLHILAKEAIQLVEAESCTAGLYSPEGRICHETNAASADAQFLYSGGDSAQEQLLLTMPIFDRQGAALGFMEIHNKKDRSEFSAADRERLAALSQAAAIAIQNALDYRRLEQAEAALKEADQRKDEFLAMLAHELRNPLAPLRNGLQVMRLAHHAPQIAHETRNMMERQLQQMVQLIDDLLDVSRITHNKLELRKERIELAKVVESALETARPRIEAMGHQFILSLPHDPVYLDADLTRLAQVFSNLLNNAAKYTRRNGRILLKAERCECEVVVTVQDNGIGIAPEDRLRIFEMFGQVSHAIEKSQRGLGIGLALARRLVEMHHGQIEAQSDGIGAGSEFIVRLPLPLEATTAAPIRVEPSEVSSPAKRAKILVADDNRDAANSLALMLELMGYIVQTAYDGIEAVAAAEVFMPDVVLLDIGMPKLTGYDAARRIRQQPQGNKLVLMALTGWGQEEDKRLAKEAGFDHHLTKPVDTAVLRRLLDDVGLAGENGR